MKYHLFLTNKLKLFILGISCILSFSIFISSEMFVVYADGPVYVDIDAIGNDNGSSWQDAYSNLQTALNNTNAGEIWVAEGIYTPGTIQTDTFRLKNSITLYGGFKGTETSLQQRNWETNVTVLSGDLSGNDTGAIVFTNATRQENSYHIVTSDGTDNSAVLDGFTIAGGNAGGLHPNSRGGGIFNWDGSNPTLKNLILKHNASNGAGGGLYNYGGDLTLSNIVFTNNASAGDGGGMYSRDGNVMLNNVTFIENEGWRGGGLFNYKGTLTMTNIVFDENFADNCGGMSNISSNLTMEHAEFRGNSAYYGGGLCDSENSRSNLSHIIFIGNKANSGGGMSNSLSNQVNLKQTTFSGNLADSGSAMSISYHSGITISNSILWGNSGSQIYTDTISSTVAIEYSIIENGWIGIGNNSINPLFVMPITYTCSPTTTGDYRLQTDSPAINAGLNNLIPIDLADVDNNGNTSEQVSIDLDGKSRIVYGFVDMGPYEYSGLYLSPTYLPVILK